MSALRDVQGWMSFFGWTDGGCPGSVKMDACNVQVASHGDAQWQRDVEYACYRVEKAKRRIFGHRREDEAVNHTEGAIAFERTHGKTGERRMRVTLVEFTGKGSVDETWRAADVMIWTKSTRIEMGPDSLSAIAAWPEEKKRAELTYMANTIPSSWEFCDYTFMIQGVTRALTHQLVRARTMSFAQQTMQVLDMSQGAGWEYDEGPTLREKPERSSMYRETMEKIAAAYKALVDDGAKIEDARGVLPTNILTNIVMKTNMRSLVQLVHARESPRNLGEISRLMTALKEEVIRVHPWMDLFLARTFDQAARDLDRDILALDIPQARKMDMCKLVDQMRQRS